jgi:hypothetical protein
VRKKQAFASETGAAQRDSNLVAANCCQKSAIERLKARRDRLPRKQMAGNAIDAAAGPL